MKTWLFVLFTVLLVVPAAQAQTPAWRQMTEQELKAVIPDKAPVEKEKIETEFRTAAGVTDGGGHSIFGVTIITAGYAADGKYTHFLKTDTSLKAGELLLTPGEYVFGYKRLDADTLKVTFYRANNGEALGTANASKGNGKGGIRAFAITPPSTDHKAAIMLGRFAVDFTLAQ
jgi:hypothetical protein